MENFKLVF